jgi:hypothetical protein
MTRGRKPIAATEPEILDAGAEARAEQALTTVREAEQATALAVSQHDAAVRAVALQLGYQLPADCTDPDLIQRDISANMRRSVEACLEVGRGLRVLKEACEHGQFVARLEVLGLDRTVAARFMQAATKLSNVASTHHLMKAIGNQTKLFEMLVLDDDQIEELELTGQTGELSLDDVATMSVKELRAALREARADNKADKELLAEKNQLLDAERAKSKRIHAAPPDQVLADLAKETAERVVTVANTIDTSVRGAFTALAEHFEAHGTDSRVLMAGHVAHIQKVLNDLRETFMLRDFEGDSTPEWMTYPDHDAPGAATAN